MAAKQGLYQSGLFFIITFKMQSPIANIGRRIRKAPSSPKWIFASKTNPMNQALSVAVMAIKYADCLLLTLDIISDITITNIKNNKIVHKNPLIVVTSNFSFPF